MEYFFSLILDIISNSLPIYLSPLMPSRSELYLSWMTHRMGSYWVGMGEIFAATIRLGLGRTLISMG